jgi:hypothetical protein
VRTPRRGTARGINPQGSQRNHQASPNRAPRRDFGPSAMLFSDPSPSCEDQASAGFLKLRMAAAARAANGLFWADSRVAQALLHRCVTTMRTRAIQLLTLVLCVTLAGGAQACICDRLELIAAEKAGSHACCPSDSTSMPHERCHEREGIVAVAVPKVSTVAPAADFTLVSTAPITLDPVTTTAIRSQPTVADIVPQLRDLHHLFTQLTE